MQQKTLCFLIDEDQNKIILGMKKLRFGKGKYNGFGGGIEAGDLSHEDAALRELSEEAGVSAAKEDIKKMAVLNFYFPAKKDWNQTVHVYIAKRWAGEFSESEEMTQEEFDISKIPYGKMWDADKHWLPLVLEGKRISGNFYFNEDNNTIKKFKIKKL